MMAARTITRPHSDEQFPVRATWFDADTHTTFQGNQQTCTHVAGANWVSMMCPDGNKYSPRFVWYFKLPNTISIAGFVANLNRVGICLESLCPYLVDTEAPYDVHDLDKPPSLAALNDAAERNLRGFEIGGGISDLWDFMRAICTTGPLMLNRIYGAGTEHAFSAPGYDFVEGMEVLDNGIRNATKFYDWRDFGLVITQAHQCTKSPWPFRVHPDYKPPTPAHFENGVLTCPFIQVVQPDDPETGTPGWMRPRLFYKNVVVHFDGELNETNTKGNDGDITGMDAVWKPRNPGIDDDRLELPIVKVGGTVIKNVSVTGVAIRIISFEEDTDA